MTVRRAPFLSNAKRLGVRALLTLVVCFLPGFISMAWSKEQALVSISAVNRALSGSRTGVLTKASLGTVRIDRNTSPLAARALIEDKFGMPLMSQDLHWDDVEFDVRYWLGTDETRNQIIQMIVSFPE
jgi:hypothetical protein